MQFSGDDLNVFRNRSIAYMLASGPDFMPQMFDVGLVVYSSDNQVFTDFWEKMCSVSAYFGSGAKHIFGTSTQFMIRNGGIDVPQMESDTFDIQDGFTTIKKVRPKVKLDKRSALKILSDESLMYWILIGMLSNNNRVKFGKMDGDKTVNGFQPNTLRTKSMNIVDKKLRVDIVVKQEKFIPLKHTVFNQEWPGTVPYWWWFEDVNFLGVANDLSFERDGSNTLELDCPFIYKRLAKINTHGWGIKPDPKDGGYGYLELGPAEQQHDQPLFAVGSQKLVFNYQANSEWYYG